MRINFTSPINHLGFGLSGINILKALSKTCQVSLFPIGPIEIEASNQNVVEAALTEAKTFDGSATSLKLWHPFDLTHDKSMTGHRCAYTFFELDPLQTNEVDQLRSQDLVFVASKWAKFVLVANGISAEKVKVAPCGVDKTIFSQSILPTNEQTTFLGIGKWEFRKGHHLLAKAFNLAFTKNDNVRLILNCSNPFLSKVQTAEWENYFLRSPLGEKVFIIPNRLSTQQDVAALMAQVDCGVFPALAEGFNLELAEMLAMGRHCIATDYSAHTEYVTDENCRLIRGSELEDAFDGRWFHGTGGKWLGFGEDQMEQLVSHMREIHLLKQSGQLKQNVEGIKTMANFTWERTADCIVESLETLQ